MKQRSKIFIIIAVFAFFYFIPFGSSKILNALMESLFMAQDYARQHVLLCLIPAFFIAGAIANFISQENVIKYFGAGANKFLSYTVASVSDTILAVCSCTVLTLFAGIYNRGAGIGPATAFLYSGPAINVLAIILTARVLGFELGLARIGAVIFSVIIGLSMHFIFIKDEKKRSINANNNLTMEKAEQDDRPLWQTAFYFAIMIGMNHLKFGK